ncbi:type II toxin-antitoxin system RelE/ParE family toxin [Macrococcus armenti]|uniref:type II toxin-antitoxin system RelE/ParE family toxin n=1 Tax=Macrococcus armenti TaxID=2875764 RepID=UPI0030BA0F21
MRSRVGNSQQRALYFQYVDNKYVITHGFTKKTQKTPKREITRAKSIRGKYLK